MPKDLSAIPDSSTFSWLYARFHEEELKITKKTDKSGITDNNCDPHFKNLAMGGNRHVWWWIIRLTMGTLGKKPKTRVPLRRPAWAVSPLRNMRILPSCPSGHRLGRGSEGYEYVIYRSQLTTIDSCFAYVVRFVRIKYKNIVKIFLFCFRRWYAEC